LIADQSSEDILAILFMTPEAIGTKGLREDKTGDTIPPGKELYQQQGGGIRRPYPMDTRDHFDELQ